MAFPTPPNPNQPIPNNPFYYPPTNRLEGGDQGLVTIGLGLTITPEGVLNATGLGPVSAVTNLIAGTGLAVDNNTGNVLITNTGVVTLNPGSGIAISGSNGNFTITNTLPATPTSGTVYQIDAGTGLSGGTITTSGTIALTDTGVAPATYTNPTITVDAQGRITFAAPGSPGSLISGTYPIQVAGGILVSIADATTGNPGAVQLENSTTSTSLTKAATANSVKVAYDVAQAASGSSSTALAVANSAQAAANSAQGTANQAVIDAATAQSTANAALPKAGGTMTGPIVFAPGQTFPGTSVPDASNSVKGIVQIGANIQVSGGVISILNSSTTQSGLVQLNDTTNSTSTTQALTANAGNVLQQQINALAVSSNLTLAGTIDASTGNMVTVTTEGAANGFVVGSPLPTAVPANDDYFAIVTVAGTMTPPGGTPTVCHTGDWWLSNGTVWQFLDIAAPIPVIAEATPNSFGTILGYTDNTDTDFNVSLGRCALNAASTAGFANVAVGIAAGYGVTTGYGNTLIGPGTGCAIADGNVNTALGIGALSGVTSGFANLGVGICSGCAFTVESGNAILGGYYGNPGDINTLVLSDGAGNLKAKFDGSGALSFDGTAYGTAGQVLSSNGAGSKPTWQTLTQCTGTVTSITAGTGLTGGTITTSGTIALDTACVIQPSAFTAKGDLLSASAAATPLALTVGTNGQVLAANSACASGLEWVTAAAPANATPAVAGIILGCTDAGSVALGCNALLVTTVISNTAVGICALASNTTGNNSTAVGCFALQFNTTSSNNTGIGSCALRNTATGGFNTAVGRNALSGNTIGCCNTSIGYSAGCLVTTGVLNTIIGSNVQVASPTGSCQLAIGFGVGSNWLTGDNTKAIKPGAGIIDCADSCGTAGQVLMSNGANAVCWGTAGGGGASPATPTVAGTLPGCSATNALTAVGLNSGAIGSGSTFNTALGERAMGVLAGTGGAACVTNSVAIGYQALASTASPAGCSIATIAIGRRALGSGSKQNSGTGNIAIGDFVGINKGSGDFNTFVGHASAAGSWTDGSGCNTVIGACAANLTTGSNNTSIGFQAAPVNFSSNTVTLGNASVTTLRAAVTTITAISDARDKTDVTALPVGLDFINTLNPVKFTWQMREPNEVKDGTSEAGFIAQELKAAQDSVNADYLGLVYDQDPERLEASAGKLVPVLVKAIQELSAEVKELKAKLEANG